MQDKGDKDRTGYVKYIIFLIGIVWIVAIVTLLFTGSTGEKDTPDYPGSPADVTGETWILTSYSDENGQENPAYAKNPPTIHFNGEDRASGSSGCNYYSASYQIKDDTLTFGVLLTTAMLCDDEAMAQEDIFASRLESSAFYSVKSDYLIIFDSSGEELLKFFRFKLPGTVWRLTGYKEEGSGLRSVSMSPVITADFKTDGTLSGYSGCNNYFASYSADKGSVDISAPGSTLMACTPNEDTVSESSYLKLLEMAKGYSLSGNRLVLTDETGAIILEYTPYTLPGTEWELVSYNNDAGGVESVPSGIIISANFGYDKKLTGNSGCNSYFADYTLSGGLIKISGVGSTEMACEDQIMKMENIYLNLLQKSESFSLSGGTLTLKDAEQTTLLVFKEI